MLSLVSNNCDFNFSIWAFFAACFVSKSSAGAGSTDMNTGLLPFASALSLNLKMSVN